MALQAGDVVHVTWPKGNDMHERSWSNYRLLRFAHNRWEAEVVASSSPSHKIGTRSTLDPYLEQNWHVELLNTVWWEVVACSE